MTDAHEATAPARSGHLPPGAWRRRLKDRLVVALAWNRLERPLVFGSIVAAVAAVAVMLIAGGGPAGETRAYWNIDPFHPYPIRDYGARGGFFYSPAIALIAAPLGLLPLPVVYSMVLLLNLASLRWLTGRWVGYALLLPPVMRELIGGNIDLPLTVAIVAGLTRPALWAAVLLTKVTPGVGLLWFVVRREWRALAMVAGVTFSLVAVSFVIAPQAWADWIAVLSDNAGRPPSPYELPVPLWLRLSVAAVLVVFGAWTNRPWLVPIAAFLGFAVIWQSHFVVLLGAIALLMRSEGWRQSWSSYLDRSATVSAASVRSADSAATS